MDEACVANIGPAGRRRRLIGGLITLSAGAAVVLATSMKSWWSMLAFVLLMHGWLGVFQAIDRT
jgi:hypothetical protein